MHTTTTTTHHPHAHPGTPPHHQGTHPHPRQQVGLSRRQVRRLRRRGFRRFAAGAAALALAATGALAAAPGTAYADAHRDGQWYLDDFNIDKVHELSQGEGVKIGVIDSGIDPNHPDLKGNVKAGADYGDSTGKGLDDPVGHGTAITSVMAGHGHGTNNADGILGIAPKAKIIPVGLVWDESARNGHEYTDAIQYLVDQDVNIIMTGQGTSDPDAIGDKAIEPATNAGIPIVAPAGNTDQDDSTTWPAKAKGVIPVTGTNQDHKFWNGSTTLAYAAPQPQLGLSAPATNIPIARPNGKYDTTSGTSFSAPIVAGTLALIKSAYPKLGPRQVNERLILTADDKGPEGFDDKYGWGIVNPYKALTATVDHHEGKPTSEKDLTPLDQQGDPVDNHPPGTTPDSTSTPGPDDEAATETPTGPPAWVTITIVAAGALLTTALITLVIVKTRRGKKNPPPPGNGPLPPGHPGGPTPPTGPTPNFHTNPAAQQNVGPTPPTQNPGQAPPPNAYGSPTNPQAPGALPPHTPQTPTHQPGQPDPAPPPPAGDSVWQPPHDPNTNPPPHQPPQ